MSNNCITCIGKLPNDFTGLHLITRANELDSATGQTWTNGSAPLSSSYCLIRVLKITSRTDWYKRYFVRRCLI